MQACPVVERHLRQAPPKFTMPSPLSLASNTLSVDLAAYLTTSSATSAYQPELTASSALTLSATSALPVDLSAYQLMFAISSYLSKSVASSTHRPKLSADSTSPVTNNALSVNLSFHRPALRAFAPLSLSSNTLPASQSSYRATTDTPTRQLGS